MSIISGLLGLGSLVCGIMVLVKLFKAEGTGKGILGLVCMLYTFIWGWQNSGKLNIKNVMMAWTALILLGVVVGAITSTQTAAAIQAAGAPQ